MCLAGPPNQPLTRSIRCCMVYWSLLRSVKEGPYTLVGSHSKPSSTSSHTMDGPSSTSRGHFCAKSELKMCLAGAPNQPLTGSIRGDMVYWPLLRSAKEGPYTLVESHMNHPIIVRHIWLSFVHLQGSLLCQKWSPNMFGWCPKSALPWTH